MSFCSEWLIWCFLDWFSLESQIWWRQWWSLFINVYTSKIFLNSLCFMQVVHEYPGNCLCKHFSPWMAYLWWLLDYFEALIMVYLPFPNSSTYYCKLTCLKMLHQKQWIFIGFWHSLLLNCSQGSHAALFRIILTL